MIKVVYVSETSTYYPPLRGLERYDYGLSRPLQELAHQGVIEFKVVAPYPMATKNMQKEFPDMIFFQPGSTIRKKIHREVASFVDQFPYLSAPFYYMDRLNTVGNLWKILDEIKPDIVISYCNLSGMKHPAKKIWVAHEYLPQTIAEFLENNIPSQVVAEVTDANSLELNNFLSNFDYAISPSKLTCRLLKKHQVNVKQIDLYIIKGDSMIRYGNKRFVLLNSTPGWFRYKKIQEAVQPLAIALRTTLNVELLTIAGLFDPHSVGCGIVPWPYKASEPSKIYTHLTCGIPSFVHPDNFDDLKDEVGIYSYSIESVLRCIKEYWRDQQSENILYNFHARHDLKIAARNWSLFINELKYG